MMTDDERETSGLKESLEAGILAKRQRNAIELARVVSEYYKALMMTSFTREEALYLAAEWQYAQIMSNRDGNV